MRWARSEELISPSVIRMGSYQEAESMTNSGKLEPGTGTGNKERVRPPCPVLVIPTK
jgi:hypothetical protein